MLSDYEIERAKRKRLNRFIVAMQFFISVPLYLTLTSIIDSCHDKPFFPFSHYWVAVSFFSVNMTIYFANKMDER